MGEFCALEQELNWKGSGSGTNRTIPSSFIQSRQQVFRNTRMCPATVDVTTVDVTSVDVTTVDVTTVDVTIVDVVECLHLQSGPD